jgi:hypothetical protein
MQLSVEERLRPLERQNRLLRWAVTGGLVPHSATHLCLQPGGRDLNELGCYGGLIATR